MARDTPALAGELNTNFADVPEDSPYYESVQYLAKEKVIPGTKDGLFHPESAMTPGEWNSIFERFQRLSETGISTDKNLLKGTGSSKPTAILPPGIGYIGETAGIKTYTACEYEFAFNLDAGTTTMLTTGLIRRDAVEQTSITRGEALRLLYEVAVKKSVISVPPNLIDFFAVSADCEEPEETEALLLKLLEAYSNIRLHCCSPMITDLRYGMICPAFQWKILKRFLDWRTLDSTSLISKRKLFLNGRSTKQAMRLKPEAVPTPSPLP